TSQMGFCENIPVIISRRKFCTLEQPGHRQDRNDRVFYRRGWTDGLPVMPPTPEWVSEFLEYAGHLPSGILATGSDTSWFHVSSGHTKRGRRPVAPRLAFLLVLHASCIGL